MSVAGVGVQNENNFGCIQNLNFIAVLQLYGIVSRPVEGKIGVAMQGIVLVSF